MLSVFHIQKTQKKQFTQLSIFLRKISVVIAYYLNMLHIKPHQVVLFRIFIFGGLSIYCFYSENYIYNLVGLGFIILNYIFDLVDGDLARNYNQVTKLGGFLDSGFDAIILNTIILTFTFKFLNTGVDFLYIVAGIMVLFGTIFSSKMTDLFQNKFGINCCQGSEYIEDYLQDHKFDIISSFFYRLITPKSFPFSLLSNFRDYLLFGIIFGMMPIAILGFAIAINIRWIILFMMISLYYARIDQPIRKVMLFNIMKHSETI